MAVVHTFKVEFVVENDDQTDAEFIREYIEAVVKAKLQHDNNEFDCAWPLELRVRHTFSGLDRRPALQEEKHGETHT